MVCLIFVLFSFISSRNTIVQIPVEPEGPYFHFQTFENVDWEKHYVISSDSTYNGNWRVEKSQVPPYENFLYSKTQNSRSLISSKFSSPLKLDDDTLVVQFEARYDQPLQCGGAYIMLYGEDSQMSYVIKFGPDLCSPNNRVHFNFTHKNKLTGKFVEHRLIEPPIANDISPGISHLYTLTIRSDNSFEILVDTISMLQGDLLVDFTPSVNPPKEIDDPNDKKPKNFDDKEMIYDKSVKKPADWEQPEFIPNPAKLNPPKGWLSDEPDRIPDPSAKKPVDWDEDFFGKWEAPLIDNPKCKIGCGKYSPPLMKNPKFKGVWRPPKIRNPDYQGQWTPRKIPNPHYYSDTQVHNFQALFGLKLETKIISSKVGFNNILVTTNESMVHQWNKKYYRQKTKYIKNFVKGKIQSSDSIELNNVVKQKNFNENRFVIDKDKKFNVPNTEKLEANQKFDNGSKQKNQNSMNNYAVKIIITLILATIGISSIVCCIVILRNSRRKDNEELVDYDYYEYEYDENEDEKPVKKKENTTPRAPPKANYTQDFTYRKKRK